MSHLFSRNQDQLTRVGIRHIPPFLSPEMPEDVPPTPYHAKSLDTIGLKAASIAWLATEHGITTLAQLDDWLGEDTSEDGYRRIKGLGPTTAPTVRAVHQTMREEMPNGTKRRALR